MAANELFDSGIKITGSFSAAGAFPADGKYVVKTIAERDDHDTQNRSYLGMLVYVEANGKTYQKQADGWKEFGFNAEEFANSVHDGLDSDSTTMALSAAQGKVLNTKIATHTEDTTIHITPADKTKWDAKAETTVATQSANGLMSSDDKTKLDGIAENANNYVHPATHVATMITEDETHRFVTDEEKTTWNAKPDDKTDIGLGHVTNDAQVKRSEMGVANGVATLDENGTVPSSQLPSYVDDVVEYDSFDVLPEAGETGKIYVTIDDNKTYRWSGTQYTVIGNSLALGETASTAYAGDKGKAVTDAVNKILDGTTVVPNATDAQTVTGHTVAVNVPADAKFTDTTYGTVTEADDGLMITADKVKLDGIEAGANKYIHPDDENTRHVTDAQIAAWTAKAETTVATQSANGLMSSNDKTKLDGIEAGANKYVHPDDASTRHVSDEQIAAWNNKAEKTTATITASGLMSAADKAKLDGIEDNANNYVHPDDENTRHVTDAQITAWTNKAEKSVATTTANGLMSATDKTKLDSLKIVDIENMTYTMPATEFATNSKVIIPVTGITSESTVTIGLDYSSITAEQYDAAGLAKFVTKIVSGGVEVTCFGEVPAIDIPVTLAIVKKSA